MAKLNLNSYINNKLASLDVMGIIKNSKNPLYCFKVLMDTIDSMKNTRIHLEIVPKIGIVRPRV